MKPAFVEFSVLYSSIQVFI